MFAALGCLGWLGACISRVPLGGLAAMGVARATTGVPQALLGGAATGAVIGTTQWLVLRRQWPIDRWRIAATALGMSLGLGLSVGLLGINTSDNSLPLRGLITGLAIGIAQYVVLRRVSSHAPLWIITVALGWALGWIITRAAGIDLSPNFSVFGSTGAWGFQLLTGLALAWIMANEQPGEAE